MFYTLDYQTTLYKGIRTQTYKLEERIATYYHRYTDHVTSTWHIKANKGLLGKCGPQNFYFLITVAVFPNFSKIFYTW